MLQAHIYWKHFFDFYWQLPDGVRTDGVIAEVPRFPVIKFRGEVWTARGNMCALIKQTMAKCREFVNLLWKPRFSLSLSLYALIIIPNIYIYISIYIYSCIPAYVQYVLFINTCYTTPSGSRRPKMRGWRNAKHIPMRLALRRVVFSQEMYPTL